MRVDDTFFTRAGHQLSVLHHLRGGKGDEERRRLYLLITLASLGAHRTPVPSGNLVTSMGISGPTLSRWLKEALLDGSIEIERGERRENHVKLTDRGLEELKQVYRILRPIFSGHEFKEEDIQAMVFIGMGEGAYYMTRREYLERFREALGYVPYPGTMNVRLTSPTDVEKVIRWRETSPNSVFIPGFQMGRRTFGHVVTLPVMINGQVRGHAVYAERRHYDNDVIEVIARENLRRRFGLKENDTVHLLLL